MNRHDLEMVRELAAAMERVARAVAEGMGEGIGKAMGYGSGGIVVNPVQEEEPEQPFIPDVELDRWLVGGPDAAIRPDGE